MDNNKKYFTKNLLIWNKKKNNRLMPWKGEKDPYKIWLSEIILQQTRVVQGWDYYKRFITAYPNVEKLAKAKDQKIFKMWEGLGYYTRCKNLIATAKFITEEKNGKFPSTYEEILALKGVGPYTAAAIASFAFNLNHAVVDGNVFRVLSRFFGIKSAINSTSGKKIFTTLSNELLDKREPGNYNQAIMDFGAVICKPKNPLCNNCILKNKCVAKIKGLTDMLPVKEGKITIKSRWFYYLLVEHNNNFYVRKRVANDIWENLYEFILMETEKGKSIGRLKEMPLFKKLEYNNDLEVIRVSKLYRQQLTHQIIQGRFIHIKVQKSILLQGYKALPRKELNKLPFPRFITGYISENGTKAFER